jgi:hypothetical protein
MHGLPLLHAGGKTGKRLMVASCQASARRRMVRSLHRSRARRRPSVARRSGSILQPGICEQLCVVSPAATLGRSTIRGFRSERCRYAIRATNFPGGSWPRSCSLLCLRTKSQARRTWRFGIRFDARDLATVARRRTCSEDGGMFSGVVLEKESLSNLCFTKGRQA